MPKNIQDVNCVKPAKESDVYKLLNEKSLKGSTGKSLGTTVLSI